MLKSWLNDKYDCRGTGRCGGVFSLSLSAMQVLFDVDR